MRSHLLLTALLIEARAVPVGASDCVNWPVTFRGAKLDGRNTTFRYRVCSTGRPAIGHGVLGLPLTCTTCADVMAASRGGVPSQLVLRN